MYVIKRYPNGRFYDTVGKKYINRKKIAQLIDSCENISIVDTNKGRDVTLSIVSDITANRDSISDDGEQAITGHSIGEDKEPVVTGRDQRVVGDRTQAAAERDRSTGDPGDREPDYDAERETATEEKSDEDTDNVFAQFLKKGEAVFDNYKKRYESAWQNVSGMPKDEIDKLLSALKKKETLKEEDVRNIKEEFDRYRKNFQDWFAGNIDNRVEATLKRMNLASRDQVRELTDSVDELNRKIQKLEKDLADKNRKI